MQVAGAQDLKEKLEEEGRSFLPVQSGNLVDKVWTQGRPAPPAAPIRIHKLEHAGISVRDKIARMRKEMAGGSRLHIVGTRKAC